MENIPDIEGYYKKYINDLGKWVPEGVVQVDLKTLHELDLLHFHPDQMEEDDSLTRYFHVIESPEKITLLNDEFVIWIVPDHIDGVSTTYGMIALNQEDEPKLEMVFSTQGVYNTSWLVLRVLEKFLIEIQETEDLLDRYEAA